MSGKLRKRGDSPRRSPCGNPTVDSAGEPDELAGAQGPAESATAPGPAGTPTPSRAPTPAPAPVPTPLSTEELFKQFMQTYREPVKNQGESTLGAAGTSTKG
ncbi:hypothetical protein MMC31_007772 [Peltigera leucophlebia]|nr:hypothetical protein [Peltigera leucophlebia]